MRRTQKSLLITSFVLLFSLVFLNSCGLSKLISKISQVQTTSSRTRETTTTLVTFSPNLGSDATKLEQTSSVSETGISLSSIPTTITPETEPTTVETRLSQTEALNFALQESLTYFTEPKLSEALNYFDEIAAHSEYNGSKAITKWTDPVRIQVHGDYTNADMASLSEVLAAFRQIEGMPSVDLVDEDANINIYYVPSKEMKLYITDYVDGNLGFFEVYWNGAFELYQATIAISTDRTGALDRKHLIWEELVQSFGLMNDSYTYEDSIFQQDYSVVQLPSALDFSIIRMLYNEAVRPGDSGKTAQDALRRAYGQ